MAKKLRKGNGEGTIGLRKDGRWESKITVGFRNGKAIRKCYFGKTRQEVADKLAGAIAKKNKGLTLHSEKQTVGAFLNRWLTDVVKPKVRPSTYRSYEGIVRVHLIPNIGHIALSKLTPQMVQAFLRERHETGRNSATEKGPTGINAEHLRRVLRAALNHAVKWDLVPRNAAQLAESPKRPKHPIAYLDPEQARKFLTAVQGHKHEALYTVAISVGLRLGEALGLKWADLNLTEGMLTIKHQLQRVEGKLQLVEPKTDGARRCIPLPPFAVEALRNHWTRQQIETMQAAGYRWQETGFVFTSEIGTPCDERSVRRGLMEILAKNDLPKLRFHDLRHSCATLLLSQGTDPRTIMQTLGHSQITLTLNTYSHVIPALQRDAADKMQKMFDQID